MEGHGFARDNELRFPLRLIPGTPTVVVLVHQYLWGWRLMVNIFKGDHRPHSAKPDPCRVVARAFLVV